MGQCNVPGGMYDPALPNCPEDLLYGEEEVESDGSSVAPPPAWHSFAAAVAWADSSEGIRFIGVEKYFEIGAAREQVIRKCQAQKGWTNCEVASSVTNGVIIIARESNGSLRARIDGDQEACLRGLHAKCRSDGVTCKVEAIYDGTAEKF